MPSTLRTIRLAVCVPTPHVLEQRLQPPHSWTLHFGLQGPFDGQFFSSTAAGQAAPPSYGYCLTARVREAVSSPQV